MKLGEIYEFTKKLGKVNFSQLVKASSGFDIIPIDLKNSDDKKLVDELTKALNNFVTSTRKATRFTGNRVNDIGSALEETVRQEILKTGLQVETLKGSGYPDLVVKKDNKITYIELKSSGTKQKEAVNHRLFYYTSGKKIKANAHHLLLQIELTEEKDKIWIVDSWTLRDLTNLQVSLKSEFNANQKDFDALGSIAKS